MHVLWRLAVLFVFVQPPADDGNLALEYYVVEQQIGEDKTWHALKVRLRSGPDAAVGPTDIVSSCSHPVPVFSFRFCGR